MTEPEMADAMATIALSTPSQADEDWIRAGRLIEAASSEGWTITSLYFVWQAERFSCQFRRYIRVNNGAPSKRQRFETVTATGDTFPLAVIAAAGAAMEDE